MSDDLLCQLFEVAYSLSLEFEPRHGGVVFSTFLYSTAQVRTIDWHRSRFRTRWVFGDGRVRERQRPQFVSLDDPDGDPLREPLSRSGLDDGERGMAAELRSLEARSRRPGGRDDWLDSEAA